MTIDTDAHTTDTPLWVTLKAHLDSGTEAQVREYVQRLPPGEVARTLDRLDTDDQNRLLRILGAEAASSVIEDLSLVQASDLIGQLPPAEAADIVEEMDSDARADILGDLGRASAESILEAMVPAEAESTRNLLQYADDVAGGLMRTEHLAYRETHSVEHVINDLRKNASIYSDFDVQYAYVIDSQKRLTGVLRLHDLLLAGPALTLSQLMIPHPVCVNHKLPLIDLRHLFDEKQYVGLPVVNDQGTLLGVVMRGAVYDATLEDAQEDFMKVSGLAAGEELRSMPLRLRAGRRLSWLSANILLNVAAASIIAFYQDTLAQVIALAVFLPIISDMSGCSGNQAVAVSIRELSLGLVRPAELARVLFKEAVVGLLNGLALGILLALVAFAWKGNPWLGLVVGGALMLNTIVSVCIGGSIPLILKRLKLDPALASGPILTTVTDMCGFLLVLGFATAALDKLV